MEKNKIRDEVLIRDVEKFINDDMKIARKNKTGQFESNLERKKIDIPKLSNPSPKFNADGSGNNTRSKYDGWENVLTGLGMLGADKRMSAMPNYRPLNWEEVESLYAVDDIAAKVVDLIPQEGTRKWVRVTGISKEMSEAVNDKLKSIKAQQEILKAWKWARMYGGAALLVGVSDGETDLSKPLDMSKVRSINSLTAFHRYELFWYGNNLISNINDRNFGLPEVYQLVSGRAINVKYTLIHSSRLIRIEGARLPTRLFMRNYFWNDSVLNRLYNVLRNYNSSNDSCASIMQDFRTNLMYIKDLSAMISAGHTDAIISRMTTLNMVRGVTGMTILDNDERHESQTTSLTGIKDVLETISGRVVAATGLPATIVLGISPSGGLSGKGESENRDLYDKVQTEQEDTIRDPLEKLLTIIINSLEFNQTITEQDRNLWHLEFNALWQMDDKEKVEIHKLQAEADNVYLTNGVVTVDEISNSRFGGEKYSLDTNLDKVSRGKTQAFVEPDKSGSVTDPEIPGQTMESAEGVSVNTVQSGGNIVKPIATQPFPAKKTDDFDIGKHSNVPDEKFDPKELTLGIKVEMEHTNDLDIAKNIAKDHLCENPKYYSMLIKWEKKNEKK